MKRDFKENPKCVLSERKRMKEFVNCLNKAEIFNEKIPYLIIHRGENKINSKLELELTFTQDVANFIQKSLEKLNTNIKETDKNIKKVNQNILQYILKKINNMHNIKSEYKEPIVTIINSTNANCYYSYIVAFYVDFSNVNFSNVNEKNYGICKLVIQMLNNSIPSFELLYKDVSQM